MTSLSLPRHQSTSGCETLSNALALLTLVALGIVWPGTDAPPAPARHAALQDRSTPQRLGLPRDATAVTCVRTLPRDS